MHTPKEWGLWLNERPENIRRIAEKIVPWKKYRDIREDPDCGNRYSPVSYEESGGVVTVTCAKSNEEWPVFGGYNVFGINPNVLVECENQ